MLETSPQLRHHGLLFFPAQRLAWPVLAAPPLPPKNGCRCTLRMACAGREHPFFAWPALAALRPSRFLSRATALAILSDRRAPRVVAGSYHGIIVAVCSGSGSLDLLVSSLERPDWTVLV